MATIKDHINDLDKHADKLEGLGDHLPPIDLGNYWFVEGYNVSHLAAWFSNLTRYGTNFKKLHNVTLFEEEEYKEAMIMYGAMAAILAIALSLVLIVFCCCNCMFRSKASRTPKYKGQRGSDGGSWLCGGIIFLVAIAGAATFVVGIVGEVRLHNGANSVCSTVDNVNEKAHRIHNETTSIQNELKVEETMKKLDAPLKEISDKVHSLQNDDLKNQIDTIIKQSDSIKKQVKQADDKIVDQLNSDKLDQMLKYIDPVQEECPQVVKYLRVGNLLVLVILAVSSLLFIIGLCNNCLRSVVMLVGYLMFNVIIVFGITAFIALIVGSDFCFHSKPLLKKYINTPVLDYYLYCENSNLTHNHHNVKRSIGEPPTFIEHMPKFPDIDIDSENLDLNKLFTQVQQFVDSAANYTRDFKDTLNMLDDNVENICKSMGNAQQPPNNFNVPAVCADIKKQVDIIKNVVLGPGAETSPDSLLGRMDSVSRSVSKIISTVRCESLSADIDGSLSNLCTTIYEAFFFFLMNSLAATLCFFVLLLFTMWMLF